MPTHLLQLSQMETGTPGDRTCNSGVERELAVIVLSWYFSSLEWGNNAKFTSEISKATVNVK